MKENEHLAHLLRSIDSEREIHRVLKNYPMFIFQEFNSTNHVGHVFDEFPLGSEFRADFVTLDSYSYGWDVYFIELEPPNDPVFNKAGTPSARLAGAVKQIDDWRSFIRDSSKELYVRQQLSEAGTNRDLLWPDRRGEEPMCSCGRPITDMGAAMEYHFEIIIGRSSELSPEALKRKSEYYDNHGIRLMTYDRLAASAEHASLTNPYE